MENLPQNINFQPTPATEPLTKTTVLEGPDGWHFTVVTESPTIGTLPMQGIDQLVTIPGAEQPLGTPTLSAAGAEESAEPFVLPVPPASPTEALVASVETKRSKPTFRWLGAAVAGFVGIALAQKGIHVKAVHVQAEHITEQASSVLGGVANVGKAKAGNIVAKVGESAKGGKDMVAFYGLRLNLADRRLKEGLKKVKDLNHRREVLREVVDAQDTTFKNYGPGTDPSKRKVPRNPDPSLRPTGREWSPPKRQQRNTSYALRRKYKADYRIWAIREKYEPPTSTNERLQRMARVHARNTRDSLIAEFGQAWFDDRYNPNGTPDKTPKTVSEGERQNVLYMGARLRDDGAEQFPDYYGHPESVKNIIGHAMAHGTYSKAEIRAMKRDAKVGQRLAARSDLIKQRVEASIRGKDQIGLRTDEMHDATVRESWIAHNKRIELRRKQDAKLLRKVARRAARRTA